MTINPVSRRQGIAWAASLCTTWACDQGLTREQDWPGRTVHLIVPAPAGGSLDRIGRLLSEAYSRSFGQPFVVENRPGASSTIGTAAVARAPADGYSLLMTGVFNAINPALYARLPYDYLRDFVHVAALVAGTNVLAVRSDHTLESLADLLAQAKAHPRLLTYASAGVGSSGHLAMALLQRAARLEFRHIPFRGGAPALQDLMSGVVDMIVTNQDIVLQMASIGKLRPLATFSARRLPTLPEIPTLVESGFEEVVVNSWSALAARTGTPGIIIRSLHDATRRLLDQAAVRQSLIAEGWDVMDLDPHQLEALVRSETRRWARTLRDIGLSGGSP